MESSASTGASPPARQQAMPHVVLVASPGAGHLIPMAELARRLVAHHGLAATLVTFTDLAAPDAHSAVLSSLADVATATLPAIPLDDLPASTRIETLLLELIRRSVPHLRALLRDIASSKAPLAALVPDFFCSVALPLAAELGVPGYIFFPSNLAALSVMRSAVELNDGADGEYRGLPDPLQLPGSLSLCREDLPDGIRDSSLPEYASCINEGRRYRTAAGFLVNTFYEMEPANVEELKQAAQEGSFPPAYPVGPFVRSSSDEAGESACIDWLDCQPNGSVVYVSFGSSGALSVEQTVELAAGLENCGHRFLWIVRVPSMDGDHCSLGKSRGDEDDPLAWLPDGFLDRTRGRGLAVSSWAPQVRVLSHPATAVFVSHCGWNSTLESVAAGVPMVAWPLHAEQRMNAVVLTENVGVAVRPRARAADGVVPGEEVAVAVKELMEGSEKGRAVRRQAGDLQQAAERAWAPEGLSRRALEEVAGRLKAVAFGRQVPRQAT